MIGLFLLALIQASPPAAGGPPDRKPGGWCRGVHMPNGQEGVNLLWTTISGPDDRLKAIAGRMKALGARVATEGGTLEPGQIRVHYQDDLDARAIGRLLNELDSGKFGPVTTKDFAMGLETLPADKCLRFVARP